MLRIFSILTILLLYGFSAFAGTPFTLCNGDGAVDKTYYNDWKERCKQLECQEEKPTDFKSYIKGSKKCDHVANNIDNETYNACVRENAAETCDMPYQDMRAEIIGGTFILKRRNVKEIDKWDVIKHKSSFALKLIAKPEPETDWGDYVFRDIVNIDNGEIVIKNGVVIKCTVQEVCQNKNINQLKEHVF